MSLTTLLAEYDLTDLESAIANLEYWKSVAKGDNKEDAQMAQKVLDTMPAAKAAKPAPEPTETENMVLNLSKGNPGAITVLAGLARVSTKYFAVLAQHQVTGSKIWCMYKDLCGQDIKKFVAALEQLIGGTSPADLTVDGKKFTDCVDE